MNQKRRFGLVRRYPIVGGRRLSNYWWSIVLFLGGCGFLLTGVSSYFNRNLLLVTPVAEHVALSSFQQQTMVSGNFWLAPLRSFRSASLPLLRNPTDRKMDGNSTNLHAKKRCEAEVSTNSINFVSNISHPFDPKERMRSNRSCGSSLSFLSYTDSNFNALPYFSKDGEICEEDQASFRSVGKDRKGKFEIVHSKEGSASFAPHRVANSVMLPSDSKGWRSNPASSNLLFFPQGLLLSFYGFFGLSFSFHLWFTLIWNVGAGFNEFNGKDKSVRVFRWGRPGKNRRIDFKYAKELIETIKIELVPKPALFLRVKEDKNGTGKIGEKNIPLTRIGDFIPLEDLETQAAELTSLLQIPLEVVD